MNSITAYHAKYMAYELTRKYSSSNVAKLTASIQDAQVDLNPHQVEAALFAFKSPLSQGAILADEVGLGKTIEAGILLSQLWAEHKRKLIIICPANLRKQWNQELLDKFFLPSTILENKSFNEQIKDGNFNPFDIDDQIIICSYQFVKSKAPYIKAHSWDLVIIDEAHRLRNVYKPSNKISNVIKAALSGKKKILLTATPLQNSILELYGLISVIDDYAFGDLDSFRKQYGKLNDSDNFDLLKERLTSICNRTLRRQVNYIHFTNRIPICESFNPSPDEHALYEMVSEFIQRPNLYTLPSSQRALITLNIRKLLASSSYAIFETLNNMIKRLQNIITLIKKDNGYFEDNEEFVVNDLEEIENESDSELLDDCDETEESVEEIKNKYTLDDIPAIEEEVKELKCFHSLAKSIITNSKAEHLFLALDKAFNKLDGLGANRKALIFTESRRTQEFLFQTLQERGYKDQVVLFNGTNNDPLSNRIYRDWLKKHKGSDRITGSPTADKRAALVEYFKDKAQIMIATEAASEGVNLQFCSLVVNYDLPWNPQRIEQRIGRCHRYGQQHDVVVVNFLNTKNAAEVRIHELLEKKFQLFDGVFGASDKVLGAIGSGVDFEKRIASILDKCRSKEEIDKEFDILDAEMEALREDKMDQTRKLLLEHFDDEVREKLKGSKLSTISNLRSYEQKLWLLTKFILSPYANFSEDELLFKLNSLPTEWNLKAKGVYQLICVNDDGKRSHNILHEDATVYRSGHPLAKKVINVCKETKTETRKLFFNYSGTPVKISPLEPFVGKGGWLRVSHMQIDSFEQEDYLIISCITDDGDCVDSRIAERLFSIPASLGEKIECEDNTENQLMQIEEIQKKHYLTLNEEQNNIYFIEEISKLNAWADDQVEAKTLELKQTKSELKEKERLSRRTKAPAELLELQKAIRALESKQSRLRREMFTVEDEIRARRDKMIEDIEARMKQKSKTDITFTIQWQLI